MAVTEAFLQTCRDLIDDLPELTAFRAAYANFASASHDDKGRYWFLTYGDAQSGLSPAYRLRAAIRQTVEGQAGNDATITPADRQSAYSSLTGQYVPQEAKPMKTAEEKAALQTLLLNELLS